MHLGTSHHIISLSAVQPLVLCSCEACRPALHRGSSQPLVQAEQLRGHLGTSNQTISGLKGQIDDLHAQLRKRKDELEQQAQEHLHQIGQLQRQLDAAWEDSAAPSFMATTRLVRWLPSGRRFSVSITQAHSDPPPDVWLPTGCVMTVCVHHPAHMAVQAAGSTTHRTFSG